MAEAYPTVTWTDDSETRVVPSGDGSGCTVAIGTKRGDPSLPDIAGSWDDVVAVADPVLAAHGFAPLEGSGAIDGGWTGIGSDDRTGAELRFADKGYTLLTLSADVTDPDC